MLIAFLMVPARLAHPCNILCTLDKGILHDQMANFKLIVVNSELLD